MYTTANFGLNIVEGTDVVNPLVQQNPNFETIDLAMQANKQAGIGSATELTAGTVHTITRANTASNYIRFTATSNWTAGDSMVIDTTPVSVYLSDGTVPGTGAYIINTEVVGILNGTRFTLLVSESTGDAYDIPYDANTSIGDKIDQIEVPDYNTVQVIGKAGGKKIKRVMFNYAGTVLSGASQTLGTIADFGFLLSLRGGCKSSNNYYPFPFADNSGALPIDVIRAAIVGDDVVFFNNMAAAFSNIYCLVEYISTENV